MTDDSRVPTDSTTTRPIVRDHRIPPVGPFTRRLQTWLMLGLAVVIIGIIAITGHPEPPTPTGPAAVSPTAAPIDLDRVRAYQQQVAEQDALRRAARDLNARTTRGPAAGAPAATGGSPSASPSWPPGDMAPHAGSAPFTTSESFVDPLLDERRRRDETSLFADNLAFSRRPQAASVTPPDIPSSAPDLLAAPAALHVPTTPTTPAAPAAPASAPASGGEQIHRLSEGTVIETVLTTRLDGTFAGPVNALVTTPVFSLDRQHVLIPAGARVLGSAAPVQAWGESRLAVTFHRLLTPDGRSVSLQAFKGLNQVGDTGLRDQVNRHYWQVFGASIAIGALSGLAQYDARSSGAFTDSYRQSAGASLAASAGRVLERYLNVLPTITIREGHRVKVYLTADLELPVYAPTLTP